MQWFIKDTYIQKTLYAQHSYSAGLSCETALLNAVNFIEKHTYQGQHVLAVSLDCSGAFDR